jgi:hypothetical protein
MSIYNNHSQGRDQDSSPLITIVQGRLKTIIGASLQPVQQADPGWESAALPVDCFCSADFPSS